MEKAGKEVEINGGIFHTSKEEKVFCVYKPKRGICWLNNDHRLGCVNVTECSIHIGTVNKITLSRSCFGLGTHS